ncbi:uncharacterized protein HD556DRAFT_1438983 [Suillus plorans]|uniref:Uncharacterized protein n=1 Tax=Suillus plorans TaxID=116603 RepID=A0A9P7DR12_9AGAM|nr:uncharacterized protein HD556DRAFT_1438983 [Suillus plorans]KAG1800984.1 hypothetical protein HD556DRAFT_1438983 [Suillus plorans]
MIIQSPELVSTLCTPGSTVTRDPRPVSHTSAPLATLDGLRTPAPPLNKLSQLKATPIALGSAVISEHIATLGVGVDDVRPWIARDIQNFKKCDVDCMLQNILSDCKLGTSDSASLGQCEESALLQTCLEAVLPLCNETRAAKDIKDLLSEYINSPGEVPSYEPFVGAANCALLQLSALNVPGLVGSKDSEDHDNILFHHNDKPIRQMHQGVESSRKPDVVIVSWDTAQKVQQDGDCYCKKDMYTKLACNKPHGNFQWKNVLSTVEFKYTKRRPGHGPPPPSA